MTHQHDSAKEAANRISYAVSQIRLLVAQVENQAESLEERDITSLLHIASNLEGAADYLSLVMQASNF